MLKITKRVDYGLTMITALAEKPDELLSLKAIAKQYDLPYKFIGQVAADLLAAKLIISKEGSTGGYKLARPAEKISLNQIMEVLDGPIVKVDCLRGKDCSRHECCGHKQVLKAVSEALAESLSQKTLADLVR